MFKASALHRAIGVSMGLKKPVTTDTMWTAAGWALRVRPLLMMVGALFQKKENLFQTKPKLIRMLTSYSKPKID